MPASAYSVTDPDTSGNTPVAIRPKASPVSAPTISDGENTPPPMRPAMVIATAITLITAKIITCCSPSVPVSASEVVS